MSSKENVVKKQVTEQPQSQGVNIPLSKMYELIGKIMEGNITSSSKRLTALETAVQVLNTAFNEFTDVVKAQNVKINQLTKQLEQFGELDVESKETN